MDAGYEPREFVFGNIAYSVGAVGGIAGTLKTLVRGEIKEFSDVFNETRHRALERVTSHAKAAGANAVVGIRTSVMHFAGFHEMYMAGTAASHPLLPAEFASAPATSDLTGEELWGMTQLGYIPLKLLISTSVYSLGAIGGIKAAFQSFVKGEIPDLTALIYDAREQVFDRLKREAAALGAEEVVGIKTYIIELGTSLVEIFSVGTAVRQAHRSRRADGEPACSSHHPRQGYLAQRLGRLRPAIDARRRLEFARGVTALAYNAPIMTRCSRLDRRCRPSMPPPPHRKVRMAEDAWNTRDPARVALAYSADSRWRNRAEFLQGRDAIQAFLARKWARELDYRLIKELWAFRENRIAVQIRL